MKRGGVVRHSISAWGALREAYAIFGNEKALYFKLAFFMSVLSLIFLFPAIEAFRENPGIWNRGQQFGPSEYAIFLDQIAYLKYWVWPYLFLSYGGLVLWSRATIGGSDVIYYGGWVSLFGRTLMSYWRLLGAILIAVIMAGLFYAFTAFFLVIIGLSANAQGLPLDNPIALLQSILTGLLPFYIIFAFGLQMVAFLLTFSVHGQSRDIHMPLHRAFSLMKKNLFWAIAVSFLLALIFQVIYTAFFFSIAYILFTTEVWMAYLGFFVLYFIAK